MLETKKQKGAKFASKLPFLWEFLTSSTPKILKSHQEPIESSPVGSPCPPENNWYLEPWVRNASGEKKFVNNIAIFGLK